MPPWHPLVNRGFPIVQFPTKYWYVTAFVTVALTIGCRLLLSKDNNSYKSRRWNWTQYGQQHCRKTEDYANENNGCRSVFIGLPCHSGVRQQRNPVYRPGDF